MKAKCYAPYVMLALALVGAAIAFYDSYAVYNSQPLWCPPPIDGCNDVANSPYARIYNLPVSYYGIVFNLYMAGPAVLLAFDPRSPALRVGVIGYAALGWLLDLFHDPAGRLHPRLLHLLSGLRAHARAAVDRGLRIHPAYAAPLTRRLR